MLRVSRSVPTPILRLQLEESQGPFSIGPCSTLFAQLEVAPFLRTLLFSDLRVWNARKARSGRNVESPLNYSIPLGKFSSAQPYSDPRTRQPTIGLETTSYARGDIDCIEFQRISER